MHGRTRRREKSTRLAGRATAMFLALSALWVLCTESCIERMGLDPLRQLQAQTAKGGLYALLAAGAFYGFVAFCARRIHHVRERELEAVDDMAIRFARASDLRDGCSEAHSERLGECSAILARHCGMRESQAERLRRAAMLHDVGKIGVRDALLRKAGRLTEDERREIERHVAIGAELLDGVRHPMLRLALVVVRTHHEAWDGSGYPSGLRGEEIPLEGRIVALCDVFDALLSERPYKQPWPFHEAVEEVRSLSGSRFDPKVVKAFVQALPELRAVYERQAAEDPQAVVAAHAALN